MAFNVVKALNSNQTIQSADTPTPDTEYITAVKKRAFANIAASTTDGAVVAAVSGYRIRVLDYLLMAGGTATNATFNTKPGGAGTAISMLHACAANGGVCTGEESGGWFQTSLSEGLSLTTGAGSTVGVQVVYVLLPV